jgi:uncharacterized protein (DUF302 family)
MDRQTPYSFSRVLSLPYGETIAKVKEALKSEGFGVLTEIDVQKTLKEKLNQDFRKYIILGACNPPLAHRVLQAEPEVGVLLPCNVLVYEEEGKTVVSAMDPEAAMVLVKNEKVSEVAKQVRQKMERVLNSL